MKNRNQVKADEMRSHIESCGKSELSVTEYCAQNGLVKSCYYYWHKRLSDENKPSGFIPVSLKRNSSIEINYPNGVQLSFTGDINAATLKALVCCI